jgi:hypothetical protein
MALEESLGNAMQRTEQENRNATLEGHAKPSAWRGTPVGLLRHQLVLLAMKHGRAPLPFSTAFWKGLRRCGVLNDLYDLGSVARRLSFLGDERMLLTELTRQTAARAPVEKTISNESEIATEVRP